MKLLLDENLSPLTEEFLKASLRFDVRRISIQTEGKRFEDVEISSLAQREDRFILTFDQEFGEHYFSCRFMPPGVVVLRLRNQRPERVNDVLGLFFVRYKRAEDLRGKLFIVMEGRTRVRRKP